MQTTENCAPPLFHRSLLEEWNEGSQFHWIGTLKMEFISGQIHVLDEHFADTSWGVVHAVYQRYNSQMAREHEGHMYYDEEIRWKLIGMTMTTDKCLMPLVWEENPRPPQPSSTESGGGSTTT